MSQAAATATATASEAATPGPVKAWIMAVRPQTLSAGWVPVLVGTACVHVAGSVRWGPAVAALAGSTLLQIGSNLANDVYDHEKGADTEERLGPTRTVQAGILSATAVRRAMALTFTLALLIGIYLTWVAGWPIIVIGLLSIASAIAYTGGPYPLGYHGLGDVFVMIFFGFVAVCGTVFVQTGEVTRLAWLASIPVGSIATSILVVNNVRDRHTDAKAGKRTLAVRLGRAGGIAEYGLLLLASYVTPVGLYLSGALGPWVLLPLVSLPAGGLLFRSLARTEGSALNQTLINTAKLLLVFGLLFTAGIALSRR